MVKMDFLPDRNLCPYRRDENTPQRNRGSTTSRTHAHQTRVNRPVNPCRRTDLDLRPDHDPSHDTSGRQLRLWIWICPRGQVRVADPFVDSCGLFQPLRAKTDSSPKACVGAKPSFISGALPTQGHVFSLPRVRLPRFLMHGPRLWARNQNQGVETRSSSPVSRDVKRCDYPGPWGVYYELYRLRQTRSLFQDATQDGVCI